jgi:hypothetical protein
MGGGGDKELDERSEEIPLCGKSDEILQSGTVGHKGTTEQW